MANRWRKAQAQPLLEGDERIVQWVSPESFDSLVHDSGDLSTAKNLARFMDELRKQGPAILPPLVEFSKTVKQSHKAPLSRVQKDLANQVEADFVAMGSLSRAGELLSLSVTIFDIPTRTLLKRFDCW